MQQSLAFALLFMLFLGGCTPKQASVSTTPVNQCKDDHTLELDVKQNQSIADILKDRVLFNLIIGSEDSPVETPENANKKQAIYEGIPYVRYWQMEDDKAYVFHPMSFGRHLFNRAEKLAADSTYQQRIEQVGYRFPGSEDLAFFYPEHFDLNRMLGPDVAYSCISQSEIVAGMVRLSQEDSSYIPFAKQTCNALLRAYREGGTNVNDVALLEMPLIRSAPEIILNGWLHALLHLSDYNAVMGDARTRDILRSNLQFLGDNANHWYNDSLHVSLYSDLSPYRSTLRFENPTVIKDLEIRYCPQVEGLTSQRVEPEVLDDDTDMGSYDNHLEHVGDKKAVLFFNCSKHFETQIVSTDSFSITFDLPTYDPMRASPNNKGEKVLLKSVYDASSKKHMLSLEGIKPKLYTGYPTNFSKSNKKNYYHVQHIMAMLYLAYSVENIDPDVQQKLVATAKAWYEDTPNYSYLEQSRFEAPQKVLDGLNRGKVLVVFKSVDELFSRAGIAETW